MAPHRQWPFNSTTATAESLLPGDRAILNQRNERSRPASNSRQVLADREHDANYQECFDIVSDRCGP